MKNRKIIFGTFVVALFALSACGGDSGKLHSASELSQSKEFGSYAKVGISLLEDGSVVGGRFAQQLCYALEQNYVEVKRPTLKLVKNDKIKEIGASLAKQFVGQNVVGVEQEGIVTYKEGKKELKVQVASSKIEYDDDGVAESGSPLTSEQFIKKAKEFVESALGKDSASSFYVREYSVVSSQSASGGGVSALVSSQPKVVLQPQHGQIPIGDDHIDLEFETTKGGAVKEFSLSLPSFVAVAGSEKALIKPSVARGKVQGADLSGASCAIAYLEDKKSASEETIYAPYYFFTKGQTAFEPVSAF